MRFNFLHDSFIVGLSVGDMWLEYEDGDKERLYGISLYLGIMVFRVGFIKKL